MAIPNYRLPPGIERNARGGPEWLTLVQVSLSGKESRIQQWTTPRRIYDIGYALRLSQNPLGEFAGVLALHLAHQGRTYPFRFKDWSDYAVSGQNFAGAASGTPYQATDGVRVAFHLIKSYDPWGILGTGLTTGLTYTRLLTCIVGTPVIEINEAGGPDAWVLTTAWSLNAETGLVTFDAPPPLDSALRWTGEFDVPVRFDDDKLPIVVKTANAASIGSITIREVIGE